MLSSRLLIFPHTEFANASVVGPIIAQAASTNVKLNWSLFIKNLRCKLPGFRLTVPDWQGGATVAGSFQASAPYVICIRRTARLATHSTNPVRRSNPRMAPGREAGAAGAASNRSNIGASASIGAGTGQSDCR